MRIPAPTLGALAAAGALLAAPAFADVRSGVDAWARGDFATAVREWRPLAERGDPDAEFNMGQAYKLGRGVPQDLGTAVSWYERAAQKGHPNAQANLAIILFQSGERARAIPWLRKAVEADDPRAQYIYGTALFNGDIPGIGKDWPRAYALMSRAAEQGMPNAARNLAQMDKLMPLAQRQQGLALARQMRGTAAAKAPPLRPAPAPAPVRIATAAAPAAKAQAPRPQPAGPTRAAPAKAAPAPAASGGGWRVQLGAFSSAANAHRQWETLRAKGGAFAGLRPITVAAGAVTRLQAGPLPNKAAAERVCAAAKAAGSACFPVAP